VKQHRASSKIEFARQPKHGNETENQVKGNEVADYVQRFCPSPESSDFLSCHGVKNTWGLSKLRRSSKVGATRKSALPSHVR
jgi:hypothetical protein